MKNELRQAIPREQIDKQVYEDFKIRFNNRDFLSKAMELTSDVFGPTTVRERWNLLGEYGLENAKRNITLEGSANSISLDFFKYCAGHGYPENVLALQFLADTVGLDSFDPKYKEDLNTFLRPQKTDE